MQAPPQQSAHDGPDARFGERIKPTSNRDGLLEPIASFITLDANSGH
jgi:hypothetical protein